MGSTDPILMESPGKLWDRQKAPKLEETIQILLNQGSQSSLFTTGKDSKAGM